MASSARAIVRNVLPRQMADDIWSGQYDKVLPITFNEFELSGCTAGNVLHVSIRSAPRQRPVSQDVCAGGRQRQGTQADDDGKARRRESGCQCRLGRFDGTVEQTILGDLLLGFSLENIRHDLGQDKQLQRVAPAHYMASWIDLLRVPHTSATYRK